MAYVMPDEEDEKQGREAASAPAQPQSAPMSIGPADGGGAAPAQQPGRTTDFVNWDQVLNANKDSAKAYGDKLAGKLKGEAEGYKSDLAQKEAQHAASVKSQVPGYLQGASDNTVGDKKGSPTQNQFGQAVGNAAAWDKKYTDQTTPMRWVPNADQSDIRGGDSRGTTSGLSGAPKSGSTPTGEPPIVISNPTTLADAKARANAKYEGPDTLSRGYGWEDLLRKGEEAERRIGTTQTRDASGHLMGDSGVEALLREQTTSPLSAGQSRMDAALVGATNRKDFDELNREYGGLLKYAQDADLRSENRIRDARLALDHDKQRAQMAVDAYEKPAKEAAAKAAQREEGRRLHEKTYSYFYDIENAKDYDTRQRLLEQFERDFGPGTYAAVKLYEDELKASGVRLNRDGTLERHVTYS